MLLTHGANVNQKLKTPLLRRHNSTSTQSLGEGTTPLLRAAASGDVALMRLLLSEHGADPAVRQKNGTTMLMLAVRLRAAGRPQRRRAQEFERGTPEELLRAVKVLRRGAGLDPNVANDQGDTALHVAHSADIVRYLAAHGARLEPRTSAGRRRWRLALARIDRSNRQLRPDAVAALKELSGGSPAPAAAPATEGTQASGTSQAR